jgi:3-phytase
MTQFDFPDGIAVIDDVVIVVERERHRVQVLRLPDYQSLGFIGEEELIQPAGLYVYSVVPGYYHLYITDESDPLEDEPPTDGDARHRIKHYTFSVRNEVVKSVLSRSFGIVGDPGMPYPDNLTAIAFDPDALRSDNEEDFLRMNSWMPEEMDEPGAPGQYKTAEFRQVGLSDSLEAAIQGYDRDKNSSFKLGGTVNYRYIESFSGTGGDRIDDNAMTRENFEDFPDELSYAVHEDGSVSSFAWKDITDVPSSQSH